MAKVRKKNTARYAQEDRIHSGSTAISVRVVSKSSVTSNASVCCCCRLFRFVCDLQFQPLPCDSGRLCWCSNAAQFCFSSWLSPRRSDARRVVAQNIREISSVFQRVRAAALAMQKKWVLQQMRCRLGPRKSFTRKRTRTLTSDGKDLKGTLTSQRMQEYSNRARQKCEKARRPLMQSGEITKQNLSAQERGENAVEASSTMMLATCRSLTRRRGISRGGLCKIWKDYEVCTAQIKVVTVSNPTQCESCREVVREKKSKDEQWEQPRCQTEVNTIPPETNSNDFGGVWN